MDAPDCSSPDELHATLIAIFGAHGVTAVPEGDWVTFPAHAGKLQGLIFGLKNVHPLCSTQVDIRFSPWPGCLICESFSGIADTREERIRQSLQVFSDNTLHVLLKRFFGLDCGEQTNELAITNHGVPRTITDGNILCRGTGPVETCADWIEAFHRLLATEPLPQGTHWVRLYYAQVDRRPTMLELLLDNEHWTSGLAATRSLPLPLGDGFFSIRMFLVIQGGVDVGRAIGLWARHPEADDERIKSLLVDAGQSLIDARRLALLLPIAFGKPLLESLGVAVSTVCTVDNRVSRASIDLEASDIFQESCAFARKAMREGTLSREEFFAIAGRDANLRAVNEALNSGSNPRDLRLDPMTILWHEEEPLCVTRETAQASGQQPWWRIWR